MSLHQVIYGQHLLDIQQKKTVDYKAIVEQKQKEHEAQ